MHAVTKRLGSFTNSALEDDNPNRLEQMPQESEKQERKAAEKETRRVNAAQGSIRALLVLVITSCLISLAVLLLVLLMLFGKIGSKDEDINALRTALEENNTDFQLGLMQRLDELEKLKIKRLDERLEEFKLKADARNNDLRENLNMTRSEMLLMTDNVTLTSRLEYLGADLSQLKSALNRTNTDLAELNILRQIKGKVIYHQTMTPLWLEAHALYISSNRLSTAEQLTFHAGSVDQAALLKVPLFPANVLQNSSMLTVRIVVSHDVSIGKDKECDIRYGLSDGMSFVGFYTVDRHNYNYLAPCFGIKGSPGSTLTGFSFIGRYSFPRPSDPFYPGQFVINFKFDERENWGSCYTAHDGGFLKTVGYSKRLDPSKGLTLEVYKGLKESSVGIKFIEVTIVDDL